MLRPVLVAGLAANVAPGAAFSLEQAPPSRLHHDPPACVQALAQGAHGNAQQRAQGVAGNPGLLQHALHILDTAAGNGRGKNPSVGWLTLHADAPVLSLPAIDGANLRLCQGLLFARTQEGARGFAQGIADPAIGEHEVHITAAPRRGSQAFGQRAMCRQRVQCIENLPGLCRR